MSSLSASAATAPPRHRPRSLPRPTSAQAGAACLSGLAATYAALALSASASGTVAVSPAPGRFGLLPALGPGLGTGGLLALVTVAGALYLAALSPRLTVSRRAVWSVVLTAHALVLAGPVLVSHDVFSYVAYGRLLALHGIDPYVAGPNAAPHDAVFPLVGWTGTPSVYGPLFTALSAAAAPLGLAASVWAHKLLAAGGALAVLLLAEHAAADARRRARVVAGIGLNPIWLVWGVGGAHNDVLMLAGPVAALLLLRRERPSGAGAAVLAAAAIKASAGVALPFVLLAGGRRAARGAALAAAALGLGAWLLLGSHALGFVSGLSRQQGIASSGAFPAMAVHALGGRVVPGPLLTTLHAGLAVLLLYVLWRARATRDWAGGIGWALLLVPILASWFLPWYTLWALPFAALARDRRLLRATLGIQALVLVHAFTQVLS